MASLLLELAKPRTGVLPADFVIRQMAGVDWRNFCYVVYRTGLITLAYDSLRWYTRLVPDDVLEWLKVHYFQLLAMRRFLSEELLSVTSVLASCGLPAMVFKGPALDEVFPGTPVRFFSDLDILVHQENLQAAARALRKMRYIQLAEQHPFHLRMMRSDGHLPVVVELHFGLFDKERGYFPDIQGIWMRSVPSTVFRSCLMPELIDHLLLITMQLPHHQWSPRLMVDIGRMLFHRAGEIDWHVLTARACAWGMRALAGAALYVAASVLGVRLPAAAQEIARPGTYVQRVQWNVAARTVTDQFVRPYSALAPLAACLLVDRAGRIPGLIVRRAVYGARTYHESGNLSGLARRVAHGATALPATARVLIESLSGRNSSLN